MTNQNPASSQPPQPILNSDLLAKLNAHADRSLDRLFTDIDELLSGDLEPEAKSSKIDRARIPQSSYTIESFQEQDTPHQPADRSYSEDRFSPRLTAELDPTPPTPTKPKPKPKSNQTTSLPLWLKALLGLGVTSLTLGSLFFWLVNERKIAIPQNIDLSSLPFPSNSQVSPADAKFADYMRKSIAKIESTPIPVAAAPTAQIDPAPIATTIPATPTQSIVATPTTTKPATPGKPISLVKILHHGNRSTAIFQIDKKSQTIKIGQKIATTNWSLINVSKTEVTVKGKGGEIRSIKIGKKF
jgi:hypothetical protein